MLVVEMTAVTPEGRITPACLGLYSDANEAGLERIVATCRRWGNSRLGIQLAHAGRKASVHVPWQGGKSLSAAEGAWQGVAASAIAFDDDWPEPQALDEEGLARIRDAFAAAARRADRLGFDLVELQGAPFRASPDISPGLVHRGPPLQLDNALSQKNYLSFRAPMHQPR